MIEEGLARVKGVLVVFQVQLVRGLVINDGG
jgi:hypothetical protein